MGESRGARGGSRPRVASGCLLVFVALQTIMGAGGCGVGGEERMVVVGIDGATMDLIGPWAEAGHLPTLARLLDEGAHGILESTIPPSSAVAWTSAVTGVNPGKHGLYGFIKASEVAEGGRRATAFYTSRDRGAEPIWGMLGRAGKDVGLINIPLTSPPEPVAGFMISGFPHPTPYDYAFPEELKREILNYRLDAYGRGAEPGREAEFLRDLLEVTDRREEVTLELLEGKDWDLFWVVFTITDRVQHYFWHFMDPEHPRFEPAAAESLADGILLAYQRVDEALGKIVECLDDRTTLLVISDHGFGPTRKQVMGEAFLAGFAVPGPVGVYATDNFGAKFGVKHRHPPPYSVTDSAAYEETRGSLREALVGLTDFETGEPVMDQVWLREEIYRGPYVSRAPEVVGLENGEYLFLNWVPAGDSPVVAPAGPRFFSAFHRMGGVLIAHGPAVVPRRVVEGANLIDLTPTVLAHLGVALPDNIDGRVLDELFVPEWKDDHPTTTQAAVAVGLSEAEWVRTTQEELERQLRSVGYLH